ncbi:hypothetical protein FBQ96_07035 [Nitrospirales bacterium NOB]|nr:hypothetical protein [Nitrospirales bacterium NOB]
MAGLVGLVGMYFTIEDAANNKVRIPLGPNQENQPPEPSAPATAAKVGGLQVPGDKQCGRSYGPPSYGAQESCTACMSWAVYPGRYCVRIDDTNIYYTLENTQGTECPSGYVDQGGTCTLQNARQATDDKTCDILLSSGQFATANDMNCGSTADGQKIAPLLRYDTVSGGEVIAYGKNSSGQPLMWQVSKPTSTKPYYTLRQYEQTQTATQTQVTTTEIQLDPQTSTITSVTTSTGPGSIANPTEASVPTQTDPQTTPTTQDTPTVKKETNKDIITCGLPGTPACAIDDTGFANRYTPPSTSTYQPDLNKQKDLVENITPPDIGFSWLPSLLPGDAIACHAIEFRGAVNVGEVNFDSTTQLDLCPYLDIVRNILGWLFGVASVIYIWRRFAGARGGDF